MMYRSIVSLLYLFRLTSAEACKDISLDTFSDRYLGGSGYTTVSPYGYQQCVMLCMERRECQSINYHTGGLSCELNTDTTVTESSLTVKDGSIFKDLNDTTYATPPVGNCQKTTCPEYHICVKLTNGNIVCAAPVPDATTTTTTTSTTTTTTTMTTSPEMICVSPYSKDVLTGLCLYYGIGYSWNTANSNCPSSARLFVADTVNKRTTAASLCPTATSCWLGATINSGTFYWSSGDAFPEAGSGTGDCLRVRDSVFKGGGCSYEVGYICEQV